MSVKDIELPVQRFDEERRVADELRRQWWACCEKNQRELDVLPTFAEWYAQRSPS